MDDKTLGGLLGLVLIIVIVALIWRGLKASRQDASTGTGASGGPGEPNRDEHEK